MSIEEARRTAGEAAIPAKKNTDCIYFLASPLTCKKGSECEFRHVEGARANPRDCWYWLNGNCLNPKCLFRHPPLEPTFPLVSDQTSSVNGKLKTPCYYFQKGCCLKGDRCPFSHGPPQALNNPDPAPPAAQANHSKPKAAAEAAEDARPPPPGKTPTLAGLPNRSPPVPAANGTEQLQKKRKDHEDRMPGFDVLVEDNRRRNSDVLAAPVDGTDLRLRLLKKRNGGEEDRRRRTSLCGRLGGRISLPEREDDGGNPPDFAGPRSLAELRAAKSSGERPFRASPPAPPASFEGPKPLSEILQRKRRLAGEEEQPTETETETEYPGEDGGGDPAEVVASSPNRGFALVEDDAASDEDGDEFAREIGIIFS